MNDANSPFNYNNYHVCIYPTKLLTTFNRHIEHNQKCIYELFHCESSVLEPRRCKNCDFKTDLKIILLEHMKKAHGVVKNEDTIEYEVRIYICRSCSLTTFSALTLLSHRCRSETNKKQGEESEKWKIVLNTDNSMSLACKFCYYKTNNMSHIEKHIEEKHNNLESIQLLHYSYKDIQRSFITEQHLKILNTRFRGWFQCEQCRFKTKLRSTLEQHVKQTHMMTHRCDQCSIFKIKWHRCTYCSYKCRIRNNLITHIEMYHTSTLKDMKLFKCERCPFQCKFEFELKEHVVKHHTNLGDPEFYQCAQCSYKNRCKEILEEHVKIWHKKLRNT